MYRSTNTMTSQQAPISDFSLDNLEFHIYEDKKKGMDPKYTIGRVGDSDRWNVEGDLPASRVMWSELHGNGNGSSQFAPPQGEEKYTVKLDMDNDFKEIFPENPTKAEKLAAQLNIFKNDFAALEESYVSWVFGNPIGPLVKFRQECMTGARKSLARSRGVKQSEFNDDDKANIIADALERFKANFFFIMRTDKNGTSFIQPKSRVMQRREKGGEPVKTTVPILDVGDLSVPLNALNNDEKHVDWGSIVGGRIRLRPYVIASGKFGITLQLLEVIKIMDRATGGPRKKRRMDYSYVLE
jgi:hypothetical protein